MLIGKDGSIITTNFDLIAPCKNINDIEELLNTLGEIKGVPEDDFITLSFQRNAIDRFIVNCMESKELETGVDAMIDGLNRHDLISVIDIAKENQALVTTVVQLAGCFDNRPNDWMAYLRSKALNDNNNILLMNNVMDLANYCFPALDFEYNERDISYIPYQMYKGNELLPGCEEGLNDVVRAYYDKSSFHELDSLVTEMMNRQPELEELEELEIERE